MRIWITTENSPTVPAHPFNSHGYHTYGQENEVNFIYLWVFSVWYVVWSGRNMTVVCMYVYICSGTHVNPNSTEVPPKWKKEIDTSKNHRFDMLFYFLAVKMNYFETWYNVLMDPPLWAVKYVTRLPLAPSPACGQMFTHSGHCLNI
jgi:hypothetical protein